MSTHQLPRLVKQSPTTSPEPYLIADVLSSEDVDLILRKSGLLRKHKERENMDRAFNGAARSYAYFAMMQSIDRKRIGKQLTRLDGCLTRTARILSSLGLHQGELTGWSRPDSGDGLDAPGLTGAFAWALARQYLKVRANSTDPICQVASLDHDVRAMLRLAGAARCALADHTATGGWSAAASFFDIKGAIGDESIGIFIAEMAELYAREFGEPLRISKGSRTCADGGPGARFLRCAAKVTAERLDKVCSTRGLLVLVEADLDRLRSIVRRELQRVADEAQD